MHANSPDFRKRLQILAIPKTIERARAKLTSRSTSPNQNQKIALSYRRDAPAAIWTFSSQHRAAALASQKKTLLCRTSHPLFAKARCSLLTFAKKPCWALFSSSIVIKECSICQLRCTNANEAAPFLLHLKRRAASMYTMHMQPATSLFCEPPLAGLPQPVPPRDLRCQTRMRVY
jgi:hypothetical protein